MQVPWNFVNYNPPSYTAFSKTFRPQSSSFNRLPNHRADHLSLLSVRSLRSLNSNRPQTSVGSSQDLKKRSIRSIFQAKCLDLGIPFQQDQYNRFQTYCHHSFRQRRIILTDAGIGPQTSKALSIFLSTNPPFPYLILMKNHIGDKGLKFISKYLLKNTNLVHIDLSSNDISHRNLLGFFKVLSRHQSITSVNLSSIQGLHRNRLGKKGSSYLPVLLENQILTILNLSGTSIGPFGLRYLTESLGYSYTLLVLDVSNNMLGGKLEGFCRKIAQTTIVDLNISQNAIGDQGVVYIAKLLSGGMQYLSNLNKLDISSNNITKIGAKLFFESLHNNAQLRDLNIQCNPLNHQSGRAICSLFIHNTYLRALNLSECLINDLGVNLMLPGLEKNNIISSLVLRSNELADSVQNIGKFLETNRSLENLDLSSNKINDECGKNLAISLYSNMSLQSLNLRNNNLKDEAGQAFFQRIRRNCVIHSLNLDFNQIGVYYLTKIKKQLQNNSMNSARRAMPQIKHKIEKIKSQNKNINNIIIQIQGMQKQKQQAYQKLAIYKSRLSQCQNSEKIKLQELKEQMASLKPVSQVLSKEISKFQQFIKRDSILRQRDIKDQGDKFMFLVNQIKSKEKQSKKYSEIQRKQAFSLKRSQMENLISNLQLQLVDAQFEQSNANMKLKAIKEKMERLKKGAIEDKPVSPPKQIVSNTPIPRKKRRKNHRKVIKQMSRAIGVFSSSEQGEQQIFSLEIGMDLERAIEESKQLANEYFTSIMESLDPGPQKKSNPSLWTAK